MVTEPDGCVTKLRSILVKLANIRRVKPGDCDQILQEFEDFLQQVVAPNKTQFREFNPTNEEERVDQLYQQLMNKSSYQNVWKVVSQLLLPHGQVSV